MAMTLYVDAFGRLLPIPERVAPDPESPQEVHEYLWSVFRDRSEQMRWSIAESSDASSLWNVEEGELTFQREASRIGFAQVGLEVNPATPLIDPAADGEPPAGLDLSEGSWAPAPMLDDAGPPTDPIVAIAPLIQCLDDSLRWFGETEISAFQVTGRDLQPGSAEGRMHLISTLGWFCVVSPAAVTPAVVTMALSGAGGRSASDILAGMQRSGGHFFEFGPLVSAPEASAAGRDWGWIPLARDGAGLAVTMPEWTPAAAGWVIATMFDAALSHDSAPHYLSVRVTRSAAAAGASG